MTKRAIYIKKPSILKRKKNTLYIHNDDGKFAVPIESLSDINAIGSLSLRSGAIKLLFKKEIPTHFFSKYGTYQGSLLPKAPLNSGYTLVRQVEHYLDPQKRLFLARRFVQGNRSSMLSLMSSYSRRYETKRLSALIKELPKAKTVSRIPELMSLEGQQWKIFYAGYNQIIQNEDFRLTHRQYHPPPDPINSLISFLNSLLYATCLSEIYFTYLHPSISFLHEPQDRRYSLALDIADIFKPKIVSTIIFSLLNLKTITRKDFDNKTATVMTEKGKEKVLRAYDQALQKTLRHPSLKRKTTIRNFLRLEAYKLIKHILGDKIYSPLTWP